MAVSDGFSANVVAKNRDNIVNSNLGFIIDPSKFVQMIKKCEVIWECATKNGVVFCCVIGRV